MSKNLSAIKKSLTFREQVELLIKRGLVVSDEKKCEEILSRVNYYKLSGYSLHLRENNVFYEDCSFDKIYKLYLFDKRFSSILFDLFETIEVTLKTQIANHLGIKYGALSYLNSQIFKNSHTHEEFVDVYKDEKNKAYGKNRFVTHNINCYGELPIWVMVELLSFGSISKMYRNLKKSDQKAIVRNIVNDGRTINTDCASNWFQSITNQRNRIAHHSRIYNRSITSQIKFLDSHIKFFNMLKLDIKNDTLFALLFVTKEVSGNKIQWTRILQSIKELFEEYKEVIEIEHLGFPIEWEKLLSI